MAQIPQPKQGGVFADQLEGQELPPEGTFVATILDIVDQFQVERKKYEDPNQTEIVDLANFLFGYRDEANQAWKIASRSMRISGNEKSALVAFLKQILGKAPQVGWDYCELRGKQVLITVEHKPSRDGSKVFANIATLSPVPAGMGKAPASKPAAAKAPAKKAPAPPPVEETADAADDPIPF